MSHKLIQVFQDERTGDMLAIENKMVNMHHFYIPSQFIYKEEAILNIMCRFCKTWLKTGILFL
jgi:aspartate carbamoyltransferase regulatory subunit